MMGVKMKQSFGHSLRYDPFQRGFHEDRGCWMEVEGKNEFTSGTWIKGRWDNGWKCR